MTLREIMSAFAWAQALVLSVSVPLAVILIWAGCLGAAVVVMVVAQVLAHLIVIETLSRASSRR